MINRYQLISILLKELGLNESDRHFISSKNDNVLLSHIGYKCIRKGFYVI